jgi:hypothetical protein
MKKLKYVKNKFRTSCRVWKDGKEISFLRQGMSLDISCGVFQIEGVGWFINRFMTAGYPEKEIAQIVRNTVDNIFNGYAQAVLSITYSEHKAKVCEELAKLDRVVVSDWRNNPNSGNKINVITITRKLTPRGK